MSEYDDSQQQSAEQMIIRNKLRSLNLKNESNRLFLANSYRKINQILSKQHKFYLTKNNIIDIVTNYSFRVQPYNLEPTIEAEAQRINRVFRSSICKENYAAHRRCSIPKVFIDTQEVTQTSGNQTTIFKEKQFGLKIYGEPSSTILYTTDGIHPLFSPNPYIYYEQVFTTMTPNCVINVIADKSPIKLQSMMLTIHVKLNSKVKINPTNVIQNGIFRPRERYPYQESNSQLVDSHINIDAQNSNNVDNHEDNISHSHNRYVYNKSCSVLLIILLLFNICFVIYNYFEMINLLKLNPSWQLAYDHAQSTKPGKKFNLQPEIDKEVDLCPCCYQPILKIPIGITQHSKQLAVLGCGVPIFYSFIKASIIILLIQLISSSLLLTVLNLDHHGQGTQNIYTSFLTNLSSTNTQLSLVELTIRWVSYFGLLVFFIYFRSQLQNINSYYDQRSCTLSDFSVILSWKTKEKGVKKKLEQFLLKNFQNLQIEDIIVIPQFGQFFKKEFQLQNLVDKKKQILKDLMNVQQIDNKINLQITQMKYFCQEFNKLQKQDQLYANKAIIIFNTDEQKTLVLTQFQNIPHQIKYQYFGAQAESYQLIQAPQPRQINWNNVSKISGSSFYKIFAGFTWSILIIIIPTFMLCYYLIQTKSKTVSLIFEHKKQEQNQTKYHEVFMFVFVVLIFLHLFNKYFLGIILHKFTEFQNWSFSSEFQFSFACKYMFGLFFNTAAIGLIVQGLKAKNYFHPLGLVEQETIIFLIHAIIIPILDIINPVYQFKKLKRKLFYLSKFFTQRQANELMEDIPYVLGDKYAEVISLMWFTFLYTSLIPCGVILSLIALCFYYWVDKYNLLRRSSLRMNIDTRMSMKFFTMLEIGILMKPIGQIIFDWHLRSGPFIHSFVMLCIGIIYIIIPSEKIVKYMVSQHFNLETKKYCDVKYFLDESYRIYHPIARFIEINKLINERKKKIGTIKIRLTRYNGVSMKDIKSQKSIKSSRQIIDQKIVKLAKANESMKDSIQSLNDV